MGSTSQRPRLITVPRLEERTASTVWHGESALLRTTFEYAPQPRAATSESFGEPLDQRFGIRAPVPRLILGDIDIAYQDERAFESIDLRTTSASWQRGPVDEVPVDPLPVWVTFDVPYDQNGIFSEGVPVAIRWDAVDGRLALVRTGTGAPLVPPRRQRRHGDLGGWQARRGKTLQR